MPLIILLNKQYILKYKYTVPILIFCYFFAKWCV